jgi:hypothetical protein
MKRNALIAAALLSFALVGSTFGRPAGAALPSVSFEHKHHTREARRSVALPPRTVSGIIPRAFYGGNPLQMLNPAAPAQYGTAAESVSVDPDAPGEVNGVKLLSISF